MKEWKEGDNGDVFSLKDWCESVNCHAFIDYDGFGYLAKEHQDGTFDIDDAPFYPSMAGQLEDKQSLQWATHIVWFNR